MLVKLLLFFCLVQVVKSAPTSQWMFLGKGCVGAKDNKFLEITYVLPPRFIGAMRLVHKSGSVGCRALTTARSNWGCEPGITALGMIVTDTSNQILYPSPRLVTPSNGWYSLPGYTTSSPQLVWSDFGNPFYLQTHQKLRIWYGEDLAGFTEFDNQGSTCMEVYAFTLFQVQINAI